MAIIHITLSPLSRRINAFTFSTFDSIFFYFCLNFDLYDYYDSIDFFLCLNQDFITVFKISRIANQLRAVIASSEERTAWQSRIKTTPATPKEGNFVNDAVPNNAVIPVLTKVGNSRTPCKKTRGLRVKPAMTVLVIFSAGYAPLLVSVGNTPLSVSVGNAPLTYG
jgi:hypothetical protein